jgi:hypothetical protein
VGSRKEWQALVRVTAARSILRHAGGRTLLVGDDSSGVAVETRSLCSWPVAHGLVCERTLGWMQHAGRTGFSAPAVRVTDCLLLTCWGRKEDAGVWRPGP